MNFTNNCGHLMIFTSNKNAKKSKAHDPGPDKSGLPPLPGNKLCLL